MKVAKGIAEGTALCLDVACQPVNPQNEGKLVHVACDITQLGTFKEEDLGVCRRVCVSL